MKKREKWRKSKIGCDNEKRSGTDRSGDGIFASHTTIRSHDISNVQEFLAILYWIRVAHFIRICLISYPCRVWKLRSGMFEWTVNENDSTLCRVKLCKKGSTACRIDRVWWERRKIKREVVKKRESAIVVWWLIRDKDFLILYVQPRLMASQCIAYAGRKR